MAMRCTLHEPTAHAISGSVPILTRTRPSILTSKRPHNTRDPYHTAQAALPQNHAAQHILQHHMAHTKTHSDLSISPERAAHGRSNEPRPACWRAHGAEHGLHDRTQQALPILATHASFPDPKLRSPIAFCCVCSQMRLCCAKRGPVAYRLACRPTCRPPPRLPPAATSRPAPTNI